MKTWTLTMGLMFVLGTATIVTAQFPTASEEHKILKQEEGDWDASITMYMGPAGPYDPPQTSPGKESNRMIGDFWIVSDFSGDFEGMPFTGLGQFGFDPAQQKYVGTWIDSFSPNATKMVGTYDAETRTMSYDTIGVGMDGNPSKGKNVVVYESEDKRTMTMYAAAPGTDDMIKVMDIVYTRSND
ncbi:MAG: DUF1579 domain-containing protein [Pirellulaceae bacterium]